MPYLSPPFICPLKPLLNKFVKAEQYQPPLSNETETDTSFK